jgi:hypothetical protein
MEKMMDEQNELEQNDPKDDIVADLKEQITILQGQVTAMEHFGNIVIGQRNEAQTEAAKLRTQLALIGG